MNERWDPALAVTQRLSGMSVKEIAADHGVSETTVRNALKRAGVTVKDKVGRKVATTCRACGRTKDVPGKPCAPCARKAKRDWYRRQKDAATG